MTARAAAALPPPRPAPLRPGAATDGPRPHRSRSPVVPSAAPSAATTPTATAQPPAASADSINLVKLVGPALLKRVVPVAVIAAVLALLGRRLFRRGGKD